MRSTSTFTALILFSVFLFSCDNPKTSETGSGETSEDPTNNSEAPVISDGHTSELSLDWYGVYQGVLPCSDCEGIQTRISLTKDQRFTRSEVHKGNDGDKNTQSGTFEWNDDGNMITLKNEEGVLQKYFVGENRLTHLDENGRKIETEDPEDYVLIKNPSDRRIENKKWWLSELMGTEPEYSDGLSKAFIELDMETGIASGNNSCNRFNLPYDLKRGSRIQFKTGLSTLMACPDMSVNDLFMETLQKVNTYSLSDEGFLLLKEGESTTLAKFKEADPNKNQDPH